MMKRTCFVLVIIMALMLPIFPQTSKKGISTTYARTFTVAKLTLTAKKPSGDQRIFDTKTLTITAKAADSLFREFTVAKLTLSAKTTSSGRRIFNTKKLTLSIKQPIATYRIFTTQKMTITAKTKDKNKGGN